MDILTLPLALSTTVLISIAVVVTVWSYSDTRRRHYQDNLTTRARAPDLEAKEGTGQDASIQPVKSFLYLDEYKMYSISSQIFGGLTEYLMDTQEETSKEEEKQSGPFGSGRQMARIVGSESRTEEKKYLHDYSFTLFERHLREGDMVHLISDDNIDEIIAKLDGVAFVEVRSKVAFNDMNMIKNTMKSFNDMGEALAYVTNYNELSAVRQQLDELIDSSGDRNTKARLRERKKTLENLEQLAASAGMRQDPTFLEKLGFLLEYGFQDQFEVRMTTGPYTFSANLKREYLREKEHLLVRKYSRFPDEQFVLFGTIAQKPTNGADGNTDNMNTDDSDPEHLKEAVMGLVEALSKVEETFSGKLANEIIIDPIALYREI